MRLCYHQMLVLDAVQNGVDKARLIALHVGIPLGSVWARLHELKRHGLVTTERAPVVRRGWIKPLGRPEKRYLPIAQPTRNSNA